jgi:hypothetical protein
VVGAAKGVAPHWSTTHEHDDHRGQHRKSRSRFHCAVKAQQIHAQDGAAPYVQQRRLSTSASNLAAQRSPALAAGSKSAAVIALLSREGGATSAELIEATDWLPHTMRAALTGLRKKGHTIERGKRGTETCYTIKAATAE